MAGRPEPTTCPRCCGRFYAQSPINVFCSDACRQGAAAHGYRSHQCSSCSRDYLFPAYGDVEVCNDCLWTFEDAAL